MMNESGTLFKLEAAYELLDVQLDEAPVHFSIALPADCSKLGLSEFPYAATPESGRVASGRGLNVEACRASCLGEAAELLSCCLWGDEKFEKAKITELGADALVPHELLGLSGEQYAERERWNSELGFFDWRPRQAENDEILEWVEVQDAYTGKIKLAPADFVFIGKREAGDEAAVAIADSNGCASGPDIQRAKLSAVLELVERDSLGNWWYGMLPTNLIDLGSVRTSAELKTYLQTRSRITQIFDISSDLKIPVIAAVSSESDGGDVAVGSAAAINFNHAAEAALTEMLQMEVTLEMARNAPGASSAWDVWRRTVDISTPPFCLSKQTIGANGQTEANCDFDLSTCLAACHAAGISVFFKDMTKSEIGFASIRALSPNLCHYKPRFARARLKRCMGHNWQSGTSTTPSLNSLHLLI